MSEFDIRIGTLLDTSKAESQLQEFVNKYNNDDTLNMKLNIRGEDELTGLEKSIKAITKLAKSIENIKINVNGSELASLGNNVNDTIKRTATELGKATAGIDAEISKVIGDGIGTSSSKLLENIETVQGKIKTITSNLENLKLNPFSDKNEIDKLLTTLNKLKSTDFNNFNELGLNLVDGVIKEINKSYSELLSTAKNNHLDDIFQTTKVEPLRQQMLALREVMDFKKLDTSGIDNLINRLQDTAKYSNDLKKSKSIFNEVASGLGNMKSALKMTDVKSSETAIEKLLGYKQELLKEIELQVDSSKVEQAQEDIKRIDESIEKLSKNSDASLVKNLIDISELKNLQDMEKVTETLRGNVDKLGTVFDKLKQKAEKLRNIEYIDISSMVNLDSIIKDIDKSMNSLDFNKLDVNDVDKIKNKLETLEDTIKHVENLADNTKLEFKFDADLNKVTSQLNGFYSALTKLNISKNVGEGLEEELESIQNLGKINLNQAISKLEEFSNKIKNLGKDMNLGDISGEMSQFTKYVNDIQKMLKQLANTKDINIADALETQIKRALSSLNQLKNGFDETQKEFAEGFQADAIGNFGNGFKQELSQINTEVDKLKTALYRIGDIDVDYVGEDIANSFKGAIAKVEELGDKLRIALNNGEMDASGVQQLRQELEQAKDIVVQFAKYKIDLDCEQAINDVRKLKQEMQDLGKTDSSLEGIEDTVRGISDAFEHGAISFDKAESKLSKLHSTMDKIKSSSIDVEKSFDVFDTIGGKIENTFQSISDAFQRISLGELIEEGIESAIQGITSSITELDSAMTELKRVAPESVKFDDSGYKQIANDAREIALSVGQTTEDVITGMSTALQMGAGTMERASAIAQSSAILQNVSDMSADKSAEAIASLVNQYYSMDTALGKVQDKVKDAPADYDNLTNAIDMVNYAGNNYAISTEGVIDALQNGGAVLSTYGITLSDSIAMISGANELNIGSAIW